MENILENLDSFLHSLKATNGGHVQLAHNAVGSRCRRFRNRVYDAEPIRSYPANIPKRTNAILLSS